MDPIPPASPVSTLPIIPLPEPKSKIGLWIVGGILLLGIGVVSGVLLGKQLYSKPVSQSTSSPVAEATPSSNPTATWKTYTNVDIFFKFPPDWDEGPIQSFGSRSVVEFKYKETPLLGLTTMGNYSQLSGKPYTTLDEYIESRVIKARDIVVNSHPAKIVTDPGDPGHVIPYEEVMLFTPDKSAIVSLYYKDSYYDSPNKDPHTLDQILSTFKFLDSNANQNYTCPITEYVDCMPSIGAAKPLCDKVYLTWATANCPNFKGAAY